MDSLLRSFSGEPKNRGHLTITHQSWPQLFENFAPEACLDLIKNVRKYVQNFSHLFLHFVIL